jgi:hypothetical protein
VGLWLFLDHHASGLHSRTRSQGDERAPDIKLYHNWTIGRSDKPLIRNNDSWVDENAVTLSKA